MTSYISRIPTPPRVLSDEEQRRLLKVTGEHRDGFRDHMLLALALGTGLRSHELLALDVGDIQDAKGKVRYRVNLRIYKRCSERAIQEILLSENLRTKVTRYLTWKKSRGEPVDLGSPLFLSREHRRLSTRQLRRQFKVWQKRAVFERLYGCHALRHSACSSLYRRVKDLRMTQRFARHAQLSSTEIYAHPSEEELLRALQEQPC